MPNAIVKNVLVTLILVVLCIVIGAEAAESKEVSLGIIVALVAGSFMLWIGPRCWVLIYLVPPVLALLPLPGKLEELPIPFMVGAGVLFYWFVMWGMGYVKFAWRGLLSLDLLIYIMFAYMVYSYLQHPVSMAIFGYEAEYVGGKEYIWAILGTLFYIAISCIPCTYQQLQRVLRWGIRLSLGACLLSICLSLVGIRGGVDVTELSEAATTTRFTMFVQLGVYGIFMLYGMNPMSKVFSSPGLLVGSVLSCLAILLSGWREVLMSNSFIILTLAIIKRELWCMCVLGLSVYGALVYLSSEGIVESFPFGAQRCLSILPGIKVSREVEADTSHSSEWRIVMWKWALDPRTKYIHDYVWGDGFGQSVDYLRRETVSIMRGTTIYGEQDFFANTGVWHNGAITAIHRLGIVGLVIISLIFIYAYVLLIRTCMQLRGTPLFLPSLFFALPFAGAPSLYYISAGTIAKFFANYVLIAMIKLFYCVGREQGFIVPWYKKQSYIPLAIQAHEEKLRPAEP